MNRYIVFIGMVFVVLAGVLIFALKRVPQPAVEVAGVIPSPSAYFVCDDGSRFTASFSDNDTMHVYNGTKEVRSLPLISEESGERYEFAPWRYVFKGTSVSVTNTETQQKTTCTQPHTATAMTFGQKDTSVFDDTALVAAQKKLLTGTWKSATDATFTRVFASDDTFIDAYGTDAHTAGTWKVFTYVSAPERVPFAVEDTAVYVSLISSEGIETSYFKIATVTPTHLDMVYLDRGNTLSFTKVK